MDNVNQVQKKLLAAIRSADYDFGLINDNDKILIGVSGGKDSMALVSLLATYRKFKGKNFEIACVHLDFGFPKVDFSPVEKYIKGLGVTYIAYPATEVYEILKAHRNPKTNLLPCSICSRMRKAVINKAANELGFHKVAFAHHMDDAIETLFLNMTFGARVATFEPKMYLENAQIEFIRPLIYAREKMLLRYTTMMNIPIAKNSCGNDKKTQREDIKETLATFYKEHPDSYNNFSVMLTNANEFKLFFDRYGAHLENGLVVKEVETKDDALMLAKVAAASKAKEDFDESNSFFYLLKKDDKPLAYLKCLKPTADFVYEITSFSLTKDCSLDEAKKLLMIFEKNLGMKHVPTVIIYSGIDNSDVFTSSMYQKDEKGYRKTIVKSIKY